MDISSYFQAFESSVRSYAGDDPLDPWDKFVEFLEGRLSVEDRKGLTVVLERLVQTFIQDERYRNDRRYVTHCIKFASSYSDPVEVYSCLHSQGVGTQITDLYLNWAHHFEKKGLHQQAEAVYQRALEHKAQPHEILLQQYRIFQSRMPNNTPTAMTEHVRQPLQNSQLVNQNPRQRETLPSQCKEPEASAPRTVHVISRSENNPVRTGRSDAPKSVSMYCVDQIQSEDGSEMSFEELRAQRYFVKCKQEEERLRLEEERKRLWESEEEVRKMKRLLESLEMNVTVQPEDQTDQTKTDRRRSELISNPQLYSEMEFMREKSSSVVTPSYRERESDVDDVFISNDVCKSTENDDVDEDKNNVDTSCGGFNHSHVTPNTSLGFIHATPSRVLPSPTVNTREALGVIMDMFQVPTLLQENMFSSVIQTEDSFEKSCRITGNAVSSVKPNITTPFMIFQDTDENENKELQRKPVVNRALTEISKSNETRGMTESLTDESAVWGARNVSVAPCPNQTRDFTLFSHLVSTPLHPRPQYSWDIDQTREESVPVECGDENLYVRPQTKLSPIMEQSPLDEKPSEIVECSMRAQGTIVGEGVSLSHQTPHNQTTCNTSKHPLVALSFPDQTLSRADDESNRFNGTKPSWTISQSPEKPDSISCEVPLTEPVDLLVPKRSSQKYESSKKLLDDQDVCMSPKVTPGLNWLQMNNTTHAAEQDLDFMMSPCQTTVKERNSKPSWNICQSPEKPDSISCEVLVKEPEVDLLVPKRSFQKYESSKKLLEDQDVCMSPKVTPGLNWLQMNNTTHAAEQDLDFMMSPRQTTIEERNSKPSWTIYQSPEKPDSISCEVLAKEPEVDLLVPKRSSQKYESSKKLLEDQDVCMSPKVTPGLNWLQMNNTTGEELDVMMSPLKTSVEERVSKPTWTVHRSPEKAPEPDFLWAKSPEQDLDELSDQEEAEILLPKKSFQQRRSGGAALQILHQSLLTSPRQICKPAPDEPMSPAAGLNWFCAESPPRPAETDLDVMASPPCGTFSTSPALNTRDVSMVDTTKPVCQQLVSDPWNEDLISSLLANLHPPLSSHPNLTVWSCRLPNITPKMSVQIAGQSLRVDFVLGQGAFATVYQATNLTSSQKLCLKVQKPANPWEFYIDSQLNIRLEPGVRRLFNAFYSAHLFTNGSVLIGELHNCGTLLSAINLYKSRSEKVMPQALVLYFTVCILNMIENLHQAKIIHADIKPDNFLLGERFLENECFDQENLDHGLTLIDLGQSIDMTLYPERTAFTAKCMTSGFQCVEMLSGRPWNYQTDYFGIAGTVYCMIFGTYMQVKNDGGVWKTNATFKRNVHADLWQSFFDTLLNVPDCGTLPCLRSLRLQLNAVLQENYGTKLRTLKNRLVVQILESRSSRR